MSQSLTTEEVYGVRFYIELALNDDERIAMLSNALSKTACQSTLVDSDMPLYEASLVARPFLKALGMMPEDISQKVVQNLEFSEGVYRSGIVHHLQPKLGEVAQFCQSAKKVKRALERWDEIDPCVAEMGILPEIGDDFAYQVEKELADQSLSQEVIELNKIFKTTSPDKKTVELDTRLRAVIHKSDDTNDVALHSDTLDLWMEDFGIPEGHSGYASTQFALLSEAFSEHVENYRDLFRLQRQRERQYNAENARTF